MRLGRISALTAALVITVGVLSGFTGVKAASAATYTHLCVDFGSAEGPYQDCAQSEGLNNPQDPTNQILVWYSPQAMTNWTYPSSNNASGEITQANTTLCMQLDNADGNIVRLATCNGDLAEQWKNIYDVNSKRTRFQNQWAKQNGLLVQCMGVETSSGTTGLALAGCNDGYTDILWGTS